MRQKSQRVGHEMDQFQANLHAFGQAVLPKLDGETADSLIGRARAVVPYPDNPMWAVTVRDWATSRANGPA